MTRSIVKTACRAGASLEGKVRRMRRMTSWNGGTSAVVMMDVMRQQ